MTLRVTLSIESDGQPLHRVIAVTNTQRTDFMGKVLYEVVDETNHRRIGDIWHRRDLGAEHLAAKALQMAARRWVSTHHP